MAITPSLLRVDKKPGSKRCGRAYIPATHTCRITEGDPSAIKARNERTKKHLVKTGATVAGVAVTVAGAAYIGSRWFGPPEEPRRPEAEQIGRQQSEAAQDLNRAMQRMSNRPRQSPSPKPAPTYTPRTEQERKVQSAWSAKITPVGAENTPNSDPNPDVSAAWKKLTKKMRRNTSPERDVSAAFKRYNDSESNVTFYPSTKLTG